MIRWCSLLFFFVAFHGCMGNGYLQNCPSAVRCADPSLRREMDNINWVPTTEAHLNRLCPRVMPALQCAVRNIQTCVGRDLVELSNSNNQSAAAFAHSVVTVKGLATEICTPGSELRRNYLSSMSCLRDLATDPEISIKCKEQGYASSAAYQRAKSLIGNEVRTEEREGESECMMKAYALACFSEKAHHTCGEAANKLFLDTLKRFQYLKREACVDVPINNLKVDFLEHLQLEGQRRSIFSKVFETKRR